MNIGFIGYGNIATAIATGALKTNLVDTKHMFVYDLNRDKSRQSKLTPTENLETIIDKCVLLFLCVKPHNFKELLAQIKALDISSKTFITVAAGISIDSITKILGETVPVVRAMPNTPLLIGSGTTAICHNNYVSDNMFSYVKSIFESSGSVYELPEKNIDDSINLNGSTPAYFYLFAKIIAEYSVKNALIDENLALNMICDTMIGAAKMIKTSGKLPVELIADVSSPNGSTVAALTSFENSNLQSIIDIGLEKAIKRAAEMGKEYS